MLSAANKSGSWEKQESDNVLSRILAIEVRRLANVLVTDAARTIIRHRNVRSHAVLSAANVTSSDISDRRAGAASHGSLPPTGSKPHKAALAR